MKKRFGKFLAEIVVNEDGNKTCLISAARGSKSWSASLSCAYDNEELSGDGFYDSHSISLNTLDKISHWAVENGC